MKKLLALPLVLAACATPIPDGQIADEETFRNAIVGKEIQLADGASMTINPDNTISGAVDGVEATGTWSFEDGFWCRTITLGDIFTEDCQLWVVDGDRLIITRDRGEGQSYAWRRVAGG
ncbi:MAG: hypothetical protein HRU32_10220 [Rhodobacteraceae bacterium]|nr:hypothetical protein [Paracoccaceae bacterium]